MKETVNVIVGVFVVLCFLAAFARLARPPEFRHRPPRVPNPNRRSSDRKPPPS